MMGYCRITRRKFYALGAFSNTFLVRTQRGNSWTYWMRIDN
jgi:hypothetical protein